MAGTCKSLLIFDPWHDAPEVSAFAVYCEEAAVIEPDQVKLAIRKRCDAARLEAFNWTCHLHIRFIGKSFLAPPWHQHRQRNPAGLKNGHDTKHAHQATNKFATTRIYICHGHTKLIPGPRNQIPVAVSSEKATNTNINKDCTASLLVAEKLFLIRR